MLTHKMLIPIAYNWVLRRGGGNCGVAFKEFKTISSEQPDVIGFQSSGNSVLVEVKVSRSDFLCDKNKSFRRDPSKGMGRYRFYLCPWGLIKPEDLPANWGLIWVDVTGKAKTMINPYCKSLTGNIWENGFNQSLLNEHVLMYSALRRLHLRNVLDLVYDKV